MIINSEGSSVIGASLFLFWTLSALAKYKPLYKTVFLMAVATDTN